MKCVSRIGLAVVVLGLGVAVAGCGTNQLIDEELGDSRMQSLTAVPLSSHLRSPSDVRAVGGGLHSNGGVRVGITWRDNSNGERGFRIQRTDWQYVEGMWGMWAAGPQFDLGPNTQAYLDISVPIGRLVKYQVGVIDDRGRVASWSNEVQVSSGQSLSAPSNLTASIFRSRSGALLGVKLEWKDNSNNELGFHIERRDVTSRIGLGSAWRWLSVVGANARLYGDAGVASERTYEYRVTAFNANGLSTESNIAKITIPKQ